MNGSQLLHRTLDMVRDRPRSCTYEVLAEQTGIPTAWLKNFVNNRIEDPGVKRVETLFVFFAKSPLLPE